VKDYADTFSELRERLDQAEGYLRIDWARDRLVQLESDASRPDLWDDPDKARRVTTELRELQDDLGVCVRLNDDLENVEVLYELAAEEGDDSQETEIVALVDDLSERFDAVELRSLLSGEHDEHDAVCDINSGAGGTDAQDWAEMLLRMYLRWADKRGLDVELQELTEGQEAGISSVTFTVRGRYAFGYLQAERGVHRLVRISPFDANARRQTSFAALKVVPFFEEASDEVDIDEKDLRIDTYRSSGAGGQHVNVTDSAVRVTHLPTGVVAACQNERSQHQNKDSAMKMLAAKLAALQREERAAELNALAGEQRDVAWGSQIRSYVLAPYQQVKDLRSGYEVGNPDSVLDGDLDPFIEAWLRWKQVEQPAAT